MHLKDKLKATAHELLGNAVSGDIDWDLMADRLGTAATTAGVEPSAYGVIMWAVDHHGFKAVWKNILSSQAVCEGYVADARKLRDDMPAMLVNAHTYVSKLLANVADFDICLNQLEGMSFPYVLYVLFAGSGQEELVARYRPEAAEQLKRYPSTLDLLPESYRKVKEALDQC